MAQGTISGDALRLGWKAVQAMDRVDLKPEGVFWLYDEPSERWRFYVITSLFETCGPWLLYFRLDAVMPALLSAHEWEAIDCFLGSPRERIVESLRDAYGSEEDCPTARLIRLPAPNGEIETHVYRMRPLPAAPASNAHFQRFRQAVRQARAA